MTRTEHLHVMVSTEERSECFRELAERDGGTPSSAARRLIRAAFVYELDEKWRASRWRHTHGLITTKAWRRSGEPQKGAAATTARSAAASRNEQWDFLPNDTTARNVGVDGCDGLDVREVHREASDAATRREADRVSRWHFPVERRTHKAQTPAEIANVARTGRSPTSAEDVAYEGGQFLENSLSPRSTDPQDLIARERMRRPRGGSRPSWRRSTSHEHERRQGHRRHCNPERRHRRRRRGRLSKDCGASSPASAHRSSSGARTGRAGYRPASPAEHITTWTRPCSSTRRRPHASAGIAQKSLTSRPGGLRSVEHAVNASRTATKARTGSSVPPVRRARDADGSPLWPWERRGHPLASRSCRQTSSRRR